MILIAIDRSDGSPIYAPSFDPYYLNEEDEGPITNDQWWYGLDQDDADTIQDQTSPIG